MLAEVKATPLPPQKKILGDDIISVNTRLHQTQFFQRFSSVLRITMWKDKMDAMPDLLISL